MHLRLFPALFVKPSKIRFIEQEKDEEVILFLRQHGIVNIPWILMAILAIFLPPLFIQFDVSFGFNFLRNVPDQVLIGGLTTYYLIILAYVIEQFLFWYYNIYIITNLHLVDINFFSLLSRDITEIEFKDVQSVSTAISGIFGSLFNFGDVIVRTAAEKVPITFHRVPRPDFVADKIQDLQTHGVI